MARQITCECGQIIRGETDHEVVEGALAHIRIDHPQLAEQVTRDEIAALIELVD